VKGYYWIVNQVISKGLHQTDTECRAFTMSLMDKLEQLKNANASDDTITDDVAAEAFVEQFGLDVFDRADNAVRANKATRLVELYWL
jgi:vacuolar protein sorting-associated protein VTA1